MLKAEHDVTDVTIRDIPVQEVSIKYKMPKWMFMELVKISIMIDVDIILVPYPVMTALKDMRFRHWIRLQAKARVCKLTDRVTKVISSTQFCV